MAERLTLNEQCLRDAVAILAREDDRPRFWVYKPTGDVFMDYAGCDDGYPINRKTHFWDRQRRLSYQHRLCRPAMYPEIIAYTATIKLPRSEGGNKP